MEREDRFQSMREEGENDKMEATGIFHVLDNGNAE